MYRWYFKMWKMWSGFWQDITGTHPVGSGQKNIQQWPHCWQCGSGGDAGGRGEKPVRDCFVEL